MSAADPRPSKQTYAIIQVCTDLSILIALIQRKYFPGIELKRYANSHTCDIVDFILQRKDQTNIYL